MSRYLNHSRHMDYTKDMAEHILINGEPWQNQKIWVNNFDGGLQK